MMKRLLQFSVFCFLTAFLSCSDEEILNDDIATAGQELEFDLSQYIGSSLGMYKGVFSTNDSRQRGIAEIQVVNDNLATAKISLTNNEVLRFTGIPSIDESGGLIIPLSSGSSSFEFTVAQDGSNPMINRAVFNDSPASIKALKENSRGAIVSSTGVYTGATANGGIVMGTWNITFDSQNDADGDTAAITTQVMALGVEVGTSLGNSQSNCSDDGVTQTCDVLGSTDPTGPFIISWSAVHTSLVGENCSQFNGTWEGPAGSAGTFITDLQCATPSNDLCPDAIPIFCGDGIVASTTEATNADEPANCGANTNFGLWYTYTGTSDGNDITISTAGSGVSDTTINVYTGDCDGLVCFGADDDSGPLLQSEFTFSEEAGTVYYIYIGAFGDNTTGLYAITVSCAPTPPECGGNLISATGATGAILDASCGVSNQFTATSTATGNVGIDADIDNVIVNISHVFVSDIDITLISPAGTRLELSTDNGDNGDNYSNTVFRDGGVSIINAEAPFTGIFQAEGGTFASTFDGESIAGDWILEVCDDFTGDGGFLNSWSINFCDATIPDSLIDNAATIVKQQELSNSELLEKKQNKIADKGKLKK